MDRMLLIHRFFPVFEGEDIDGSFIWARCRNVPESIRVARHDFTRREPASDRD